MCDYMHRPVGIHFRQIDGLEHRCKQVRSIAPDQALIVLCRTIGSVGISRVPCTPWSTSSFYLTGVPDIIIAFVLDTHTLCTSHTHFWCEYIILACCCSSKTLQRLMSYFDCNMKSIVDLHKSNTSRKWSKCTLTTFLWTVRQWWWTYVIWYTVWSELVKLTSPDWHCCLHS